MRIHFLQVKENDYNLNIGEEKHIQNIQTIVDFSKSIQIERKDIPINFGISQKLFNLYLKYCWCSRKLNAVPVHFPVDRLIQEKLNQESKEIGLNGLKLKAWTQLKDKKDYRSIIEFAEKVIERKYPARSLAEMELAIYTRRK